MKLHRRGARPFRGAIVAFAALALLAASCGSDNNGNSGAQGQDGEATTTTAAAVISTTIAGSGGGSTSTPVGEVEPASGTLRMVEFSPVTTFDPAGAQTAQSTYLYPVYDTLVRQDASFGLLPNLATEWHSPEANVWEFILRDDVVFHDGAAFDAQVAADNMERAKATAGNPNADTWSNMVSATAVDPTTLRVEFENPQPHFPMQMSMVMGMMVSPEALESDLTRSPAGSGPWIWSAAESQAGVTEVYLLNEDYWNPADQGVERVEIMSVPDNSARLNAILTGEADIAASLSDPFVADARAEGFEVLSVPNYLPYIVVMSRDGMHGEGLADERVRQAIAYSVDRDAYLEAIHAGNGESGGGIYPRALAEWHVPALDDAFPYDPDKARELLAEAGYPDGITVTMPVMPAITGPLDLIVQMLGSGGITVELTQINNGELGPRVSATENREFGLTWSRGLLYHPANDLPKWFVKNGMYNPARLDDQADLEAMMIEAAQAEPAEAKAIYDEVMTEMVNRAFFIPLAHGAQNVGFDPELVTGVVIGLNMQGPMPYGVRVAN